MKLIRAVALGLIAGLFITSTHGQTVQADPAPGMPAVWPSEVGSVGSSFKTGSVRYVGKWLKWTRTRGTLKTTYIICAKHDYTLVRPNTEGRTPIQSIRMFWVANVDRDCSSDPQLQPLFEAALAAQ